jgi:predicted enzyme related to lactoylglutathione lyase
MARISYLELPVGDVAGAKAFYSAVFDWAFTDFGPDYASTMSGGWDDHAADLRLSRRPPLPLPRPGGP